MAEHVSEEGDSVASICWAHYRATVGYVEAVLAHDANRHIAALHAGDRLVLPVGTVVTLPVFTPSQTRSNVVNVWD